MNRMDPIFLKNITKMSQEHLHSFLKNYLKLKDYKTIIEEEDAFLYAPGNIPFMLVAHLDTVHRELPQDVFYDSDEQVMWSPQGIGGDDRAGVFGILNIIEHCKPHVLFLHDEEIGGVGAHVAAQCLSPNVNFMIELDRNGRDDAVFYDCGNKEFKEHILSYGFNFDYGSFSDISILSPMWDIASVNLSIGYYKAHSNSEYIRLNELQETVDKVIKILNESDVDKFYDFQEIVYRRYFGGTKGGVKDYNSMTEEELNEIFGWNKDEV